MPIYELDLAPMKDASKYKRHPKCAGWYDEFTGDYDCDYQSVLTCEECKYGRGTKDPEAKCNQI